MSGKSLLAAFVCAYSLFAPTALGEDSEFSLKELRAKLSAPGKLVFGDQRACTELKRDIEQTDKVAAVIPDVKLAAYDPAIAEKYVKSCSQTDLSVVPGYSPRGSHESFLDQRAHGEFKLHRLPLEEPGKMAILIFARIYMTDRNWQEFGGAKNFPANLPKGVYATDNYSILIPKGCGLHVIDGTQTVGQWGVTQDTSGVFRSGNVNYLIDAYTNQEGDLVNIFKVAYDKYLSAEPKPLCTFQQKYTTAESARGSEGG